MTTTIRAWTNGALILLTLLAIYAAGHSQAMQARLDHSACHPNLKP
jgi:hypothetical protein